MVSCAARDRAGWRTVVTIVASCGKHNESWNPVHRLSSTFRAIVTDSSKSGGNVHITILDAPLQVEAWRDNQFGKLRLLRWGRAR